MDRAISMMVLTDETNGPLVLETMTSLARLLERDGRHKYINVYVSSSTDSSEDEDGEELYCDEETMAKVHRALSDYGLNYFLVQQCMNRLHNDGILFRERSKKD